MFSTCSLGFVVVIQQGDLCILMLSDEHPKDKYKLSFLKTIQLPLLNVERMFNFAFLSIFILNLFDK